MKVLLIAPNVDGTDVGEALMENGLLHVDLSMSRPETVVQTIQIKKG